MYKIILYMLIILMAVLLHATQVAEELAMHVFFKAKQAVNYAAHAAAQQLDSAALAYGVLDIDSEAAAQYALAYLRANLGLDESNVPAANSFLKHEVEIVKLKVIDASYSFPYDYESPYGDDYQVRFHRPGVVLIVRIQYPATFTLLDPIIWEVKSSAQIVYN